jgi:hypothetical protein
MVGEITGILDLYSLFVNYVFGGFWMSVIGIALVLFIIMGVLGRISIYTTTLYVIMFVYVMALGSGTQIIQVGLTLILLTSVFISFKKYLDG